MDRFTDFMVKDETTGECFRADHLLEDIMEKMMADPKCPPEKKAEYQLISNQVPNISLLLTTFTATVNLPLSL